MPEDETVVMVSGALDPKDLPVEPLAVGGGEAKRRKVSDRLGDEVVVLEPGTKVDAHLDTPVHRPHRSESRVPWP